MRQPLSPLLSLLVFVVGAFMTVGAVLPGPEPGVRVFVLGCGACAAIGAVGQVALWWRLRQGLPEPEVVTMDAERAVLVPRFMLLAPFGVALMLVLDGCLLVGTVLAARADHPVGAGLLSALLALGMALIVPGLRLLRHPGGIWLTPSRVVSRAGSKCSEIRWEEVVAAEDDRRTGGIRVRSAQPEDVVLNVHELAVPPEAVRATIDEVARCPGRLDAYEILAILGRHVSRWRAGYVPMPQGDRSAVGKVALALMPVLIAGALLLSKFAGH